MNKYEVRVYRRFYEDYVDLEITATSKEKAQAKAVAEAKKDARLLFGEPPTPDFEADDPEPIE